MPELTTNQNFSQKTNLVIAYFWCSLSYVLAVAAGLASTYLFPNEHLLFQIALADVVATIVVFVFSYLFKNSSFYDPYWSLIPILIASVFIFFALEKVNHLRQIFVFVLVCAWGLRLTYNWLRRWHGLADEDWRYKDLSRQTGKMYWSVSFLGIHLFPTVLVFLACLPLYPAMGLSNQPLGLLDILALFICTAAILIEGISDNQLRKFIVNNQEKGKFLDTGLWAYSRHPNYFGEILFWWGLYLFAPSADLTYWWTFVGALAISLMFFFISVPMIDIRFKENKKNYASHMKRVSAIVPWFVKK